jgi:hypothetical protein
MFCWPQSAFAARPLASGVFWQIDGARLASWSDAKLASEVALLKRAGLDTLIIHHTVRWDSKTGQYVTFVPNTVFPLYPEAKNRDALGAIFKAAEEQHVKIVLGDIPAPSDIIYKNPQQAIHTWLSEDANNYRRALIEKYKDSPSFYGYYISNELNPRNINAAQKKEWIDATRKVAQLVKGIKPDLTVIHPIGLYAQWTKDSDGLERPHAPSPDYLNAFWRDWVKEIPQIDAWMMIDGIGTSLASLQSTDVAQTWGAQLAHDFHKQFWVDVENAVMGNKGYFSFPFDRLKASLVVAAKHGDYIVLFEYLSYMSPNNDRVASQNLYLDYLQYYDRMMEDH